MVYETIDKKFPSFSATLKNEQQVVVREATIQDAADFIRCVKGYIAESDFMVMEEEEFAPDIRQGREFIQSFIESDNSLLIVAVHNDKIIGNLDITGGRRIRLRHTGLVGLGMLPEYQNLGLGSVLLKAGIDWASKNPVLEKLWLQIVAANEAAVNLYKKMGFAEEGRQKAFIRSAPGTYYDNLLMAMGLANSSIH
jgi:RimJ/RimL family protein N-acetyltransferase